jgi:hypothetical protein
MARKQIGDLLGELDVEQIARRQVDRDRDVPALRAPLARLAQRRVDHVGLLLPGYRPAQIVDLNALLGYVP